MNKLTKLAKSEKGKELIDKAQAIANDPKNREKLESARGKVVQQIDAAKHKIAEKRGEKDETPTTQPTATGDPAYGEESPAGTTPTYGETDPPAGATTAEPVEETADPAAEAAVDAAADTTTTPDPPKAA
jgi:hypothetical protein